MNFITPLKFLFITQLFISPFQWRDKVNLGQFSAVAPVTTTATAFSGVGTKNSGDGNSCSWAQTGIGLYRHSLSPERSLERYIQL